MPGAGANALTCPGGKRLQQNFEHERSGVTKANIRIYRASLVDCGLCALKQKCCPGQPRRKVTRHVNEEARDYARSLKGTPEFDKFRDERKGRDALCPPQDPPPFRAHASQRSHRCPRRVPPRGHRVEPQDARQPHLASAAQRACPMHPVRVRSIECHPGLLSARHCRAAEAKMQPSDVPKTGAIPAQNRLLQHHRPFSVIRSVSFLPCYMRAQRS
jgi:hypothetical protein